MSLHLITGYKGATHISSEDVGAFNAGTFGAGEYVLKNGRGFEISVLSNNSIKIYDGDAMIQGRHVNLKSGTYEELTINNGEVSKNRNDIVVIRYTKDISTGIENAAFAVVQGEATSGDASDPELSTGDILSGNCLIHEMPLYRIPLTGLTVGEPVKLFKTISSFSNHIVTGAYTGDGNESKFIDLGFTPDAIYVTRSDGSTARTKHNGGNGSNFFGGFALKDRPCMFWDGKADHDIVKIVENGFTVHNWSNMSSVNGSAAATIETNYQSTYYYVAFNMSGG